MLESDLDTTVFSWLISRNATKYAGFLGFAINFECLAEDDTIDYSWSTSPFEGVRVLNTMRNSETIVETYPDILEQWKNEVMGTDEDALAMLASADIVQPMADEAGAMYTDESGALYIL